ncbi:MAG: hypothetical protein AB9873_16265 [Syntrophobacteraceae bacterium]
MIRPLCSPGRPDEGGWTPTRQSRAAEVLIHSDVMPDAGCNEGFGPLEVSSGNRRLASRTDPVLVPTFRRAV